MAQPLEILLANPRGFCAGVERAILVVEEALNRFGAPVYVRHEIVHNKWVVDDLRARGVVFVKELAEVPEGKVAIFSAHGVPQRVIAEAGERKLLPIDATCPLVTKVHNEVKRHIAGGLEVILIGHKGHPEVEGTMGQIPDAPIHLVGTKEEAEIVQPANPDALAYATQTTLSVDDTAEILDVLKRRFPAMRGPASADICYATQNRQDAVKALVQQVDLLLVVGSANSSNSNRLRDLGEERGIPAYLIEDASRLQPQWFDSVARVGLSAGASAPEHLVQGVVSAIAAIRPGAIAREADGKRETVHFNLPRELRASA